MRHQRYVLLSYVVAAALMGWAIQAACVSGFAQFAIPDNRVFGLLNTTTVVAYVSGGISFIALLRNVKVTQFTDEVIDELSKVTWPTREETMRASTTVVLTTFFTAAVLAAYDAVWKNLADLVLFNQS